MKQQGGIDVYQKAAYGDLEESVRHFLPLVGRIVARMAPFASEADSEDLRAQGAIGLYAALQSFDSTRGVPLEAYVAKKIHWAVTDALRTLLGQRRLLEPLPDVDVETLSDDTLLRASQDALLSLRGSLGLVGGAPEDALLKRDLRWQLAEGIERLPEKERLVLALVYIEELTIGEAAHVLSLSPSHTSRLHGKAILRLRGMFGKRRNELLSEG